MVFLSFFFSDCPTALGFFFTKILANRIVLFIEIITPFLSFLFLKKFVVFYKTVARTAALCGTIGKNVFIYSHQFSRNAADGLLPIFP